MDGWAEGLGGLQFLFEVIGKRCDAGRIMHIARGLPHLGGQSPQSSVKGGVLLG